MFITAKRIAIFFFLGQRRGGGKDKGEGRNASNDTHLESALLPMSDSKSNIPVPTREGAFYEQMYVPPGLLPAVINETWINSASVRNIETACRSDGGTHF